MCGIIRILGVSVAAILTLSVLVVAALVAWEARKGYLERQTAQKSEIELLPIDLSEPLPAPDRSIIDFHDHIDFQQRQVLATLLMSMFMTHLEPRLLDVQAQMPQAVYGIYFKMSQIFVTQFDVKPGTVLTAKDVALLVRDVANNQEFFWFCAANVQLIEDLKNTGDLLGVPRVLLPTQQTVSRLQALHAHFLAPYLEE